jgi:hypothetical protein
VKVTNKLIKEIFMSSCSSKMITSFSCNNATECEICYEDMAGKIMLGHIADTSTPGKVAELVGHFFCSACINAMSSEAPCPLGCDIKIKYFFSVQAPSQTQASSIRPPSPVCQQRTSCSTAHSTTQTQRASCSTAQTLSNASDVASHVEPVQSMDQNLQQVRRVLTKAGWVNHANLDLPAYPQELQDFLQSDCPFESGKKRHETHFVFPRFPEISLDDGVSPMPFNLETLLRLDQKTCTFGHWFSIWHDAVGLTTDPTTQEFCWCAMPYPRHLYFWRRDIRSAMEPVSPPCYDEHPEAFDLALGMLWFFYQTGKCFLPPNTYALCKERVLITDFLYRERLAVGYTPITGCMG